MTTKWQKEKEDTSHEAFSEAIGDGTTPTGTLPPTLALLLANILLLKIQCIINGLLYP